MPMNESDLCAKECAKECAKTAQCREFFINEESACVIHNASGQPPTGAACPYTLDRACLTKDDDFGYYLTYVDNMVCKPYQNFYKKVSQKAKGELNDRQGTGEELDDAAGDDAAGEVASLRHQLEGAQRNVTSLQERLEFLSNINLQLMNLMQAESDPGKSHGGGGRTESAQVLQQLQQSTLDTVQKRRLGAPEEHPGDDLPAAVRRWWGDYPGDGREKLRIVTKVLREHEQRITWWLHTAPRALLREYEEGGLVAPLELSMKSYYRGDEPEALRRYHFGGEL